MFNTETSRQRAAALDDDDLLSQIPDGQFTNAIETIAERRPETVPLTMGQLSRQLNARTGGWPKRIGSDLFVRNPHAGVIWLRNADALFAWIQGQMRVDWHTTRGCISRRELLSHLQTSAEQYEAVEDLPHFPPRPGRYYMHQKLPEGDGAALENLLDRFSPATPNDRELLRAALVSVFWGGPPGTRPCFVITSDDGRGVGKTKFVEAVAVISGGSFDVSRGEAVEQIKKRLLTPEARTKRVVLFDNVKAQKLSWAELEALITCPAISGNQNYCGERTRPNDICWFLTMNGAAMSKDMAQRAVIIKLKTPARTATWEEELFAFIRENRWLIIADIAAFLQGPEQALAKYTRWATWERGILSRLVNPEGAQQEIVQRQANVDADDDEAQEFEELIAEQLDAIGYDSSHDAVFIPNKIAKELLSQILPNVRTPTAMKRTVNQWSNEGSLKAVRVSAGRTHGRGLVWAKRPGAPVQSDLEERMALYGRTFSL